MSLPNYVKKAQETEDWTTTEVWLPKPTYVYTDKPKKKMKEETVVEPKDKKGKSSGSKDACYHKVKSRYSVKNSIINLCIGQVS